MKRMTALFLTGLLLLLIFAGCRTTPPVVTTTKTPVVTTTTTPPPTTTIPPATTTVPPPTAPLPVGWTEQDGRLYYYTEDSVMLTGWQEIDGKLVYFTPDGPMAVGKQEIDGVTHWFGSDGVEILLVNPWNFMPEDYAPEVVEVTGWWWKSSVVCHDALQEMLQACRDAGLKPYIASAYRTHGDQRWLYNNKVQNLMNQGYGEEEAKRLAGTVIAVPGTSEHELGLAFDLTDDSYRNLDEAQENTAVQKWLMENSWRYGFILRYPNNKSEVTGIIYEPWHYRYVGKEIAQEIYESGLCLEEYLEAITPR